MGRILNIIARVMPAGSLGAFSDGQLAALAQHTKKKGIDLDYNTKSPGDWPGICELIAVSVIAIGGRIYVASNVKGGKYNICHEHERVRAALLQGQVETSSIRYHRTTANCGEQAAAIYFIS